MFIGKMKGLLVRYHLSHRRNIIIKMSTFVKVSLFLFISSDLSEPRTVYFSISPLQPPPPPPFFVEFPPGFLYTGKRDPYTHFFAPLICLHYCQHPNCSGYFSAAQHRKHSPSETQGKHCVLYVYVYYIYIYNISAQVTIALINMYIGDVAAQRLENETWLLIGWICDGSLAGYVASHWLEMWLLIGWRCVGSLAGDVASHWLDM